MQRNVELLTQTIQKYLERKSLHVENPSWEIKKSKLGGFGIFATRTIETGEVIFKDHPVILGPRAALTCPISCVSCYKRNQLKPCKKCGLQVCSECQNQNSRNHQECEIIKKWMTRQVPEELSPRLVKVSAPIRAMALSDEDKEVVKCLKAHQSNQHGFEVDFMKKTLNFNIKEEEEVLMRFVCSVMDSNAFEVILGNENNQSSLRGLYPLASLANHSCTPNTIHVFDNRQRMVVRASNFIPKGAEIYHSYSRHIWGTPTRRYHLYRTKHFLCKCERCQDPTEFGSYISAILCKICKTGKVIPINPLIHDAKWQCESCGETVDRKEVAALSSLLGSALNSFDFGDIKVMLGFVQKKLPTLVPENNEAIVEIKYKLIWFLGYHEGFTWSELPDDLLSTKVSFCKDLLNLLDVLRLNRCKIAGLLLFELFCCFGEVKKRRVSEVCDNDMKNLFLEAADILMYDVGAPDEIRKLWSEEILLREQ